MQLESLEIVEILEVKHQVSLPVSRLMRCSCWCWCIQSCNSIFKRIFLFKWKRCSGQGRRCRAIQLGKWRLRRFSPHTYHLPTMWWRGWRGKMVQRPDSGFGVERATLGKGASWSAFFSWIRRGRGDRCWRCQGGSLLVHHRDGGDVQELDRLLEKLML